MLRIPLTLLLAAVAVPGAYAATFTVNNTTLDLGDINPGDGECAWATFPPPDQRCTLRAAIMEANALPGADTIIVPFSAHIVLDHAGRNEDAAATGDLDITGPLTIGTPNVTSSARAIIDADGIDRVFDIRPNAGQVTLFSLAIRNGNANDANTYLGGGIRAEGNGTLSTLNVLFCEISGNVANAGAGIWVFTGSGRSLFVFDSAMHGNLVSAIGVTNVEGSAIDDSDGGPMAGTSVQISNSTIYSNLALNGSGSRAAVNLRAPLTVENSTFSGNAPKALYTYATNTTLNHVTITGSQIGYEFGGNSVSNFSSLSNTIIAGNTDHDCQFDGSYGYSHNYSLDSDGTCNLSGFGTGNLPNSDPLLKPLAVRYGDTPVHDLRAGSPAIDHGDPQMFGSGGTCLGEDQDGLLRPQDGDGGGARCDMGAIEYIDLLFADGFEPPPF